MIFTTERVQFNGRPIFGVGLPVVGVGDVGDLIAYRQAWEPFIAAHLQLWRHLNELFESTESSKKCPPGIFAASQIQHLDPTIRAFCASLAMTRIRVSDTDPGGILPQWNAWKNKSSAEIVQGAKEMLEWHQEVVLRVGNQYKDDLIKLAETWKLGIELPDLPPFSLQQEIIARIEGAYITTKGTIQIVGYGIGETLNLVNTVAEAVAQGLSDTAKALPQTASRVTTILAVAAALVAGGLIVYYVPRRTRD